MIGICGMEGIGKTAIAKAVCSRFYNKFQGISLLEDIQHADDEHKFVKLQKQLLQNVLKIRNVMSLSDRRTNNISVIRSRLYQKKMLLVLDNLDNKEQAYSITGEHDFLGPGSRISVTTRDEQLLDDLRVDEKFMVRGLNLQDSLQLFCNHAFAQGSPRKGYEKLSEDLVHYVGGIPLAIETFASFLSGKTKDELQQVLKKLIKDPHLDSIGVYLRSTTSLHSFKRVGPYGGTGNRFDDNAHTSVRKISVFTERVINSIIIEYDHDGSLVRSSVHGKLDTLDSTRHMVALDYPNEFLISISGYIAEDYGFRVIRSLRFQSNKRLYGPFGEETGTYFTFPTVDNGRIIGLFGNSDNEFVDSIGAYFGPIPQPYPFNSLGPTDGEGKTWDDKKHMDIRQIDVWFSSEIESISVVYDNYGHPLGFTHGDAGGEKRTVMLDYPDEYLISILGYTDEVSGTVRVRSLTFQSNIRKYGPFGQETGMHFPSQWSGGKIVGFFGTIEDSHLRSIRAHLEPVSHIHPRKDAGPFGGECGRHWDDENLGSIKRIVITWGEVIHSIKFDGSSMEGITHGGSGGSNEHTIELRCPDEYINMMSGNYKEVDGEIVIVSLTFRSNLMTHGPYGGQENPSTTYFRTPWNIGMINGFFGRSGAFLNSIGAHFAPVYHKLPLKAIGPFGDDSGDQWDDGVHGGVRNINLWDGYIIDAIGCVYVDGGEAVEGSRHGGDGGRKREPITLDDPNEYVRSISGHIGQLEHYMCIRSLMFKTNRQTYGPYGTEVGTPFSFESDDSKIVGFFGSSSKYLHSISAHVEALPS